MKKFLNKTKASFLILRIAIISFPYKVLGQKFNDSIGHIQTYYGVEMPEKEGLVIPLQSSTSITIIAVKIAQILLIAIIFIVGIVNFIRIKNTDDKALKKKKIRNTIIIISILILLLFAAFIIPARLLTR